MQHLEDAVDLLDAGEVAQRRRALVEQRGAQQRDGGILARLDVDGAGEAAAALDLQVDGATGGGTGQRDELGVERFADPREAVEGEVLPPGLDARDGALARLELGGEVGLRQASAVTRLLDRRADAGEVVIRHTHHGNPYMR